MAILVPFQEQLSMEQEATKRFKVVTLGCRTNQYESQAYINQLENLGYSSAKDEEKADLCIVNTCTVTQSADSHSRHALSKLHRENPSAKIVVTGCYAENNSDQIAKLPGVELIVPNQQKESLVSTLFPDLEVPEFAIKDFESHTRAFVKVQDGCNSFCTYCVIPYTRGRSRSRSLEDIVKEVEGLIASGFKEIVLTGINIGDFDGGEPQETKGNRLADLVRICDGLEGLERLRVSSIDPDEVDEALLEAVIHGKKTCHSMHIVLQSGSNVILKRMNRKYTRQIYLDTIDRLKSASANFTFTTDVIVGFPGETDSDFEETLAVLREVKFAKVHMFPYSDRPRTRSNSMPNKVPSEEKQRRKSEVLRLSESLAFDLRKKFLGQTMSVLTESFDPEHPSDISGHTDNFLPVRIPGKTQSNELVKVELIENTPKGFIGKISLPD